MNDNIKTITLCGSTKFKDDFLEQEKRLLSEGYTVLSLTVFSHADNIEIFDEELEKLKKNQYRNISMSDAIFVINKNGYIGPNTLDEINYAVQNGKKVLFMENKIDINSSKFHK